MPVTVVGLHTHIIIITIIAFNPQTPTPSPSSLCWWSSVAPHPIITV